MGKEIGITYRQKYTELKEMRNNFDIHLGSITKIHQRVWLMSEIVRITVQMRDFEHRPIERLSDMYPEYTQKINSRINTLALTLEDL